MKIGISLLLWAREITEPTLSVLPRIKAAGFDGVEVADFDGTPEHYRWMRSAFGDQGLAATMLGFLPDAAHNPIAAETEARQSGIDHLKRLVDRAEALGAEVLGGPLYQPLGIFTGTGPTAAERERLVEAHRAMADHAAGTGLTLAVEPVNRFEGYAMTTVAEAAAHVAAVSRPGFGFLYDSFHGNIEERDPIASLAANGAALAHVHLSENDRGTPGRGHVDLVGILRTIKAAGYDRWVTVEALGPNVPELSAAARIWRDLYETEDEVLAESMRLIRSAWDA